VAERIPDAPAPESEARSRFCHTVGLMLHKPITFGRASEVGAFGLERVFTDEERREQDPGDLDALHAAKDRAYELWNPRGVAPTQTEVDEMIEMIPVRYRELVLESARRLRERSEAFDREYGRGHLAG
jgi:hypothetical protein